MIIRLNKLDIRNTFWFLTTVVFLKPPFFDSIKMIDDILTMAGILLFIVLLYLYICRIGFELIFGLVVFTSSVPLINTILLTGNVMSCFSSIIQYTSIFLIIRLWVSYDSTLIYRIALPIMKTLVILNAFTIALFPNGLYRVVRVTGWNSRECWLLGLRNGEPFWIIFLCMLLFMDYERKQHNIKSAVELAIFISISVWSLAKIKGGGATLAGVFILTYLLARNLIRKFNFQKIYPLLQMLFFGIFVVFQLQTFMFEGIEKIVSLLNRDVTFTGRTYVWKKVLFWIHKSLIIGWGIEYDEVIMKKISVLGDTAFVKCHNTYLDMLYSGGILMFIAYVLLIVIMIKWNKNTDTKIWSCVAYFYLGVAMLLGQTETAVYNKPFMFMTFICLYAYAWKGSKKYEKSSII